ncbi:hypothetical protein BDQ12DRAFT_27461 [Crucibulum laeve]|uniref:C2H2-type domain-containing protein n=1 Tax=Crucibulum laeve TaxID=68775 RepID=A0A5C3MIV1_9AGAR|nr:hypothetical protein BDQ12DRAFT_27461 [Crucibulum laeve]
MSSSNITISQDGVVALAKDRANKMKCDWSVGKERCGAILGSWTLLQEHLLRHCRRQKRHKSKHHAGGICNLPRCNARVHSTPKALEDHVIQAHLSRIPLSCPINTDACSQLSFSRPIHLRDHFREYHLDLEGRIVQLPTNILRPMWRPFFPRPSPPPSYHLSPGLLVCAHVPHITLPALPLESPNQFSIAMQRSPRKHQLRNDSIQESEESAGFELEPLAKSSDLRLSENIRRELAVWRRPKEFQKDLSRPQPLCNCLHHEAAPPISILYEVFAQRLEQLANDIIPAGYDRPRVG